MNFDCWVDFAFFNGFYSVSFPISKFFKGNPFYPSSDETFYWKPRQSTNPPCLFDSCRLSIWRLLGKCTWSKLWLNNSPNSSTLARKRRIEQLLIIFDFVLIGSWRKKKPLWLWSSFQVCLKNYFVVLPPTVRFQCQLNFPRSSPRKKTLSKPRWFEGESGWFTITVPNTYHSDLTIPKSTEAVNTYWYLCIHIHIYICTYWAWPFCTNSDHDIDHHLEHAAKHQKPYSSHHNMRGLFSFCHENHAQLHATWQTRVHKTLHIQMNRILLLQSRRKGNASESSPLSPRILWRCRTVSATWLGKVDPIPFRGAKQSSSVWNMLTYNKVHLQH